MLLHPRRPYFLALFWCSCPRCRLELLPTCTFLLHSRIKETESMLALFLKKKQQLMPKYQVLFICTEKLTGLINWLYEAQLLRMSSPEIVEYATGAAYPKPHEFSPHCHIQFLWDSFQPFHIQYILHLHVISKTFCGCRPFLHLDMFHSHSFKLLWCQFSWMVGGGTFLYLTGWERNEEDFGFW